MKKILLTLSILVAFLGSKGQMLWDDFENPSPISYVHTDGALNQRFDNVVANAVNMSDTCARYARNIAVLYDVIVINPNGILQDIASYNDSTLKINMKVWSPSAGDTIQITLEDNNLANSGNYPTGRHSEYRAITTVANTWENLEFTLFNRPDMSMTDTTLNQMVILFEPGQLSSSIFLFDSLVGPTIMPVAPPAVNSSTFIGDWVMLPAAGALGVGPSQGDVSWWASNTADVTTRSCFFNDTFSFQANGDFFNIMDSSTWLETWQGASSDMCGTPVAPHDGSNTMTWEYDSATTSLKIVGQGGHIGIPKAANGFELSAPSQAPDSLEYLISFSATGDTMYADISAGAGWWHFELVRTSAPVNPNPQPAYVMMNPPELAGEWILLPEAGALGVGPAQGDISWWSSSAAEVGTRDCLFDDRYVLDSNGVFTNVLGAETWLESWQGVSSDMCGTPIAPHDGSASATWGYDTAHSVLRVRGVGAYLGIPKAANGFELTTPSQAPDSLDYIIDINATNDTMTTDINMGSGWWRFILVKSDSVYTPPVQPCDTVALDTSILENHECQRNITYVFENITRTVMSNPLQSGNNTSAMCAKVVKWTDPDTTGVPTDGAFGGDLHYPFTTGDYRTAYVSLYDPHAPSDFYVIFRDAADSVYITEILTTSSDSTWEEFGIDLSGIPTNVVLENYVLLLNPGTQTADSLYFDDFRLSTDTIITVSPCDTVAIDTSILEDYECQRNVTYEFENITKTLIDNPLQTGNNTSITCAKIVKWTDPDTTGVPTDGAFGGDLDYPFTTGDFKTAHVSLYDPNAPSDFYVIFRDAADSSYITEILTTSSSSTWEEFGVDLSGIPTNVILENYVLLLNPGTQTEDSIYFDNFRLSNDSVIPTGPCVGVAVDLTVHEDFDCQRNMSYDFVNGDNLVVANPVSDGVNSSSFCGKITKWVDPDLNDSINVPHDGAFGGKLDNPFTRSQYKTAHISLYDPSAPQDFILMVRDANDNTLAQRTFTTSNTSGWEEYKMDLSGIDASQSIEGWIMVFNPGTNTADSIFYDDFRISNDTVIANINEKDITIAEVSVYPNPFENTFTISSEESEIKQVIIYNAIGEAIDARVFNAYKVSYDDINLQRGVYFIEIRLSDNQTIYKTITK